MSFVPFSFKTQPPAVRSLLAVHAGVYLAQWIAVGPVTHALALVPVQLLAALQLWRPVTYIFLHNIGVLGFFFFLIHMYILSTLGRDFERRWGAASFLFFYVVCGVAGAAAAAAVFPSNPSEILGSSTALLALLAGFATLAPGAEIVFYFMPMTAKQLVGLVVVLEVLMSVARMVPWEETAGNLAGMAAAYGLVRSGWLGRDWGGAWRRWRDGRHAQKNQLRIISLESEVDRILDKVLKHGASSLTRHEQELMQRYSKSKKVMPELPEVETIRRDLSVLLAGKAISRLIVHDRRALEGFGPDGRRRRRADPAVVSARLAGRAVREVVRRGKYLIFLLEGGPALLSHLRMTGQLIWGAPRPQARAHLHFEGTADVLSYCDTRRFGELWLSDDWRKDPAVAALGPEPLEPLDAEAWGRALRRSSAKLQSALLDQRRIAGLGNIYVTEALWRSGLRPTRRSRTLRAADVAPLLGHVRAVLEEGVLHRGVSFRDYRDARGEKGRARERLAVYGKAGQPCPRCAVSLKSVKVSGRGTVYCPGCQK